MRTMRKNNKALICTAFLSVMMMNVSFGQQVSKTVMARGKTVYVNICMACHMEDGAGVPRMNAPLAGSKTVKGAKEKPIGIVLGGLSGVEIEGDRYENVMASHADLKDQEIADVLTYVRNSFGNKASAVSAAEVTKVRGKMKK
jgi:mono/diheme cytochrome c family protein